MKSNAYIPRTLRCLIVGLALLATAALQAKQNPTSKLYIADLEGQSEIDTGDRIEDIRNKSVHNAQGTIIETKADSNNSMVFSNGTGVFLDPDTRMEVKRFVQEPFTPNRTDLETEPSISQTYNYVPRGRVGICAPRMVAGSSMVYATPHASVSIRGKKVVVETENFETKISSVEGQVTVKGEAAGGGGQVLEEGQQAVLRKLPGQPMTIEIRPIPDEERPMIEDKVTMACNARRTVYFDVAKKKSEVNNPGPGDGVNLDGEKSEEDDESPSEGEDEEGFVKEDELTPGGLDDLFLDDSAGSSGDTVDELIPVVVTPVDPPQEVVGSQSAITTT